MLGGFLVYVWAGDVAGCDVAGGGTACRGRYAKNFEVYFFKKIKIIFFKFIFDITYQNNLKTVQNFEVL